MKNLILIFCLSLWSGWADCNKNYELHFIRIETMNETGELFKYDLKSIEKVDKTSLKINSESDLFVDLDDEWHMWIQAFHNKDGKEEFSDTPTLSIPKKGVCAFTNSTYRQFFYEKIKDFSNLPAPDTCPIKAGHYYIKDYVFEGDRYTMLLKPGLWKINMFISQDHDGSHVTKLGLSIFSSVTQTTE